MSSQEPPTTRQRIIPSSVQTSNPASLSADPSKKVPRNKPNVKAPFVDLTMGRFLLYLVLGLLAVAGFYAWRFTVWAADAGGYWNLVTGRRHSVPITGFGSYGTGVANENTIPGSQADVQDQIWKLAASLGIKPAELSAAIRPLLDPSAPHPATVAADSAVQQNEQPGLLGVIGEALLDD